MERDAGPDEPSWFVKHSLNNLQKKWLCMALGPSEKENKSKTNLRENTNVKQNIQKSSRKEETEKGRSLIETGEGVAQKTNEKRYNPMCESVCVCVR